MKSLHQTKWITLIALLFGLSQLQAQDLKFSGQVYYKSNTLKGAKIEIVDQEQTVVEDVTHRNGKFKIKVEQGKIYFLKISKEKFVPKIILISAFTSEDEKIKEHFEFDIELHKQREFRYVKEQMETKPVAHIFYNSQKEKFDWDRSLTKESKEEVAMLKELNKEKRNEKYSKF